MRACGWFGWVLVTIVAVTVAPPMPGGAVPVRSAAGVDPVLEIAPTSWWMVPANASVFRAVWTGIPPECNLTSDWYRWSTPGPTVGGVLNATDDATANFSAATVASGTTELELRSAATEACSGAQTAVVGTAFANVSVDAPLAILNATAGPNPEATGTVAGFSGTVAGGWPPYVLRVTWDDGTVGWANLSAPGPFSLAHRYAAGRYVPSVVVADADGLVANATAAEPLTVGDGLEAAIAPSSYTAEVGVPDAFRVAVLNGTAYSWAEVCEEGTDVAAAGSDPALNCTFEHPGRATVSVSLDQFATGPANTTASLSLPVEGPLAVSVAAPGAPAEVGGTTAVPVTLAGGVPPFRLTWSEVGNRSAGATTVYADGTLELPFAPVEPGEDDLSVVAVDAVGATAAAVSPDLPVAAPLDAGDAARSELAGGATRVLGALSILAGAAPFEWDVSATAAASDAGPLTGSLAAPGDVVWNATFPGAEPPNVTVVVVDAAGSVWVGSLVFPPTPPLRAQVRTAAGATGLLDLTVVTTGGVPPVRLWVNTSAGTAWNATVPADGDGKWAVPVDASGNLTVSATVVDAAGRAVTNTSHVVLPPPAAAPTPPPPPAPSAPNEGWVAPLVVSAACVAVGVGVWRLRRHAPAPTPSPPPDARGVLRQIIHACDGVDRATVELLAEEDGLPVESARAELDRLIADGTVRSEVGSNGVEILAWANLEAP